MKTLLFNIIFIIFINAFSAEVTSNTLDRALQTLNSYVKKQKISEKEYELAMIDEMSVSSLLESFPELKKNEFKNTKYICAQLISLDKKRSIVLIIEIEQYSIVKVL